MARALEKKVPRKTSACYDLYFSSNNYQGRYIKADKPAGLGRVWEPSMGTNSINRITLVFTFANFCLGISMEDLNIGKRVVSG
jgi:hypothetical protein